FPEEFTEIAARHHDCVAGRERDMIGLVHASCSMADALGFGAVQYSAIMTPEQIVCETPVDLQRRFPTKWDEVQARISEKLESLNSLAA
ncbi:MAG: hypothetical protein M3Z36_11105, partial [Acidobacteriota bacterium]|nr:hypothetical protein [Acidobacteriota bacterium]